MNLQDLNTSYRPLLIGMLLGACLVIGGMVYTMQLGSQVARTHSSLTSATEHIIHDINDAHLSLEEILVGDAHETTANVHRHLSLVRDGFHQLQYLSGHTHALLSHIEFEKLPLLQQKAFHTFNALAKVIETRLTHPLISITESRADEHYDALFDQFNSQMKDINTLIHLSLQKHMSHLINAEIFTIFLSLIIMIVTIWVALTILKKQKKIFTHLLHSERAQHTTEEKYRALVEQSPLSIQLMSPDGTILQVNKAWEELWGITGSALHDYNIFKDPLIKASGINDLIVKGFAGEPMTSPVVNFNPNSISDANTPFTNCFVRTYIYPVRNMAGDIEQVIVRYEDVTTNYLQHKFQLGQNQVLELISDPSSSLQDVLRELILFVEEQAPQMMGSILLIDESGRHIVDAAGPHLPDAYRQAIDGAAIGPKVGSCGTAAYTGQRVIVSDINTDPLWKDFKDLAISFDLQACWSQPIKDSEGKILGTFAMYYHTPHQPSAQDLNLIENTAQLASIAIVHKQSMDKVIVSEALMAEAQKISHVGSWELNLQSDQLTWSDEIYRIFEIDKATFGASYDAFLNTIHPEDRDKVNQAYTQSLKTKQPYEINHRLLMADGRIKHVTERCRNIFDASGQVILSMGTVQDISSLVEAQEEKASVQSKMEHVQRLESLGVLAGGIAHDFNNILTAIMGNAGLASNKLPEISPVHGYIQHITQASQKAADLCKQMLAYSGKGKFIIKPVLLSELVEEMGQLLHVSIAKNIVLRFDLNKQTPAVDADITQIQQIIMNLVINASEAIGEHSGAISVSTGVVRLDKQYLATTFIDEGLEEGPYVYLEVSDTGCGMSAEVKEKIFEPFFTTKFTGRGLGMAAILGIVRGHKGAIKVYSEEGKGSTFKVLFPYSTKTPIHLQDERKSEVSWHGEGTVLIIDDEETIREVAASMLTDMGMQSMTACDGVEGIEVFKQHHKNINVVLLDMTMPRMGGEDAFTELCRIDADVKVILSSGYNEQDATNRFAGKGLAGFLQKPYTPEQLAEKVAAIFNKT